MSGGLDSSVAAALMVERGWEVIGFTLHMVKEGSRCCSLDDVQRARRVCDHLGIRHYTLNVVDAFEQQIIRPFAAAYAAGKTPNPCVFCNRYFKFGEMFNRANALGCTHLATGHYVRIEHAPEGARLLCGNDPKKDQSYFLHRLTQEQLQHCFFPVGELHKEESRAIAAKIKIPTKGMRETSDLCFITKAGPGPLVERYHPEVRRQGNIVDEAGHVLGKHEGLHRFTIGQRGGIGIAAKERLYVRNIHAATNTVVVAPREQAMSTGCTVVEIHWQSGRPPTADTVITARLRYQHPGVLATLQLDENNKAHVTFAEPQFAVTPGQSAVFYAGDVVLGGGWIVSSKS